jgi:CyaY protein
VNSHSAARQIWVAANLAASHFSYDEKTERWFDSRTGQELWDRLHVILTERLGHAVKLSR